MDMPVSSAPFWEQNTIHCLGFAHQFGIINALHAVPFAFSLRLASNHSGTFSGDPLMSYTLSLIH
jgi:hypothetical protein